MIIASFLKNLRSHAARLHRSDPRVLFCMAALLFGGIAVSAGVAANWRGANVREQVRTLQARAEAASLDAASADVAIRSAGFEAFRKLMHECRLISACDQSDLLAHYESIIAARSEADSIDTQELLETSRGRLIGNRLPEIHRAHRLLKGQKLQELIELNEPVKAALDDWLTSMRPQLIEAYKNYAYMRPLMLPAYQEAELPEALLFGILAKESAGRVHAYSKAGAAGPLQFMPATAMRFGLLTVNGFDSRLDPSASALANARYINEQLARLNNDLELVLAAYNGGEGRVGRLYAQHQKGFWNDQIYLSLPDETRQYVPSVLAAAYLFLHPEEFGLKFPNVNGVTAELKLDNALSMSELAICLGQDGREEGWFRTLRNLNPAIKPDQRLPGGSKVRVPEVTLQSYRKRCLDNDFMQRIAALHEARVPSAASLIGYKVRAGDTLSSVVRKAGCSDMQFVASINQLAAPRYALKPGQVLRLPNCG